MFPGNHDCQTIHGWYKTLSDYDKENLKEFAADSENDTLYKNLVLAYTHNRGEGTTDYTFKIDEFEVFFPFPLNNTFNLLDFAITLLYR